MRAYLTLAVAVAAAVVLSLNSASAQDCHSCGGVAGGRCGAHGCRLHRGCGHHGCGHHGCHGHHNKYYEGRDYGFNCGCNGSYNYPVPPLYTYHWPGMYKAERMTDYHSPWRFPPIKPFMDEVLAPAPISTDEAIPSELQPISLLTPISSEARLGEPEEMSQKLLKSFR